MHPGKYCEVANKHDNLMSPLSDLLKQTQSLSLESDDEYMPTPKKNYKLHALNQNIATLSGRRVSPVRFQLNQDVTGAAKSTRSYIKRKAYEVVETTLECIAPGQSRELLKLITEPTTMDDKPANEIMKTLISLFDKAPTRQARLKLLAVFVQHFTKTQLKEMVPGLTTWKIEEARKYADDWDLFEPKGTVIRYRLDEKKVDHFIDFISSPYYLQDVAYGTRKIRLSNGEVIEIPNMVRTVINARMIKLYKSYCQEVDVVPLGRSMLFSILKVNY